MRYNYREHWEQGQQHEKFARTCTQSDWAVVARFYAALHYVQAYFALQKNYPQKHSDRNQMMRADPILGSVHLQYQSLEQASRQARYSCQQPNDFKSDLESLTQKMDNVRDAVAARLPNIE